TILRTCRKLGQRQRPILGVNLGRLGFLAELSPLEFQQHLPQIVRRGYKCVEHLMFECRLLHADGSVDVDVGLNEAAVLSAGSLQLVQIDLSIDGERVATYSGDGLIVSTPVGSTAHSLAAGGPILKHDLQAFVITPVCAHTLTNRPLVDRADCVYTLNLPDAAEGVTLVVDGQIKRAVRAGDRIEIRRAPVSFQLARLPQCSFYGTLHDKLGWGGQPRYGR
ncbi:MAG TPA: NAD(+)/NADH kinase, partial [Planctomycetaceae bacterium]|nr:NAD(+)/NADH kinase [Planctomycetaceae bacterium]